MEQQSQSAICVIQQAIDLLVTLRLKSSPDKVEVGDVQHYSEQPADHQSAHHYSLFIYWHEKQSNHHRPHRHSQQQTRDTCPETAVFRVIHKILRSRQLCWSRACPKLFLTNYYLISISRILQTRRLLMPSMLRFSNTWISPRTVDNPKPQFEASLNATGPKPPGWLCCLVRL